MKSLEKKLTRLLASVEKEPEKVARLLASRYITADRLAVADYGELVGTVGLADKTARLIRLSAALRSRSLTESFAFRKSHTEEEILDFLKGLYHGVPNETVYMLTIDGADRVIACEFIGDGTVNSSGVLPRKLLEIILADKSCRKAILAHNHPGGLAKASLEDVEITSRVASLLSSADRELVCHYVIAGKEHFKITAD